MKNEIQIQNRIHYLQKVLKETKSTHDDLDQISMLSNEGKELRARANRIKGKIEALKWVIT